MNKKGICPYCGNDVIIHGALFWDDKITIVQVCNCIKCGKTFDEVYTANYNCTETYDEKKESGESSDKCKTCKHWIEKEKGLFICGLAFSLSNPQYCKNNNLYEQKKQ